MLTFDAPTHTYTLNGRRLPSVTQVLQLVVDYSRVPADVLEAARVFGSHVHEACDLFDRGQLDWMSLDPALVPYVEAWRQFCLDSGAIVIASEIRLFHEKLRYAGTADVVLAWNGKIVIPDRKSTAVVPPSVGAQTAAYAKAYQAMHGGREPERRCIQLNPDATYRVHAKRDAADWSLFLSCLNVHNFREKHYAAA